MPRFLIGFLLVFFVNSLWSQPIGVSNLKCQYREFPLGVDHTSPPLSWQLHALRRNVMQSAYRILVADKISLLQNDVGNIWDSKKVVSGESIQISYAGKPLHSGKVYYWKVMVWDDRDSASGWSNPSGWQMGLLNKEDWKAAQWIAYDRLPDSQRIVPGIHGPGDSGLGTGNNILPLFRKALMVSKPVKRATAFVAGLGHFDFSINGKKVGDHFLDAGWTQYSNNALYVTFDITGELTQEKNVLGVMLGNGFYYTPRERYRKITIAYGYPKMICRVVVEYADGTIQNCVSDDTWKTIKGPITFSSIYGGEDYDANREQHSWNTPGFNDQLWKNALEVDGPLTLSSQTAMPLKVMDSFSVKKITQPKPGIWVYDFGQNASGIFKIRAKGKRGDQIIFRPAELLTNDGLITQEATGTPVFFTYTFKGDGVEEWQPQFTYYGFRFIQVEGAVPEGENNPRHLPVVRQLKSLHTRNAAATAGNFFCSNHLFNQTNTLINWAIKSNMASVLTDCPHREKLGWLEEVHLMGSSVRYNYDIASLCRKLVTDMMNAQTADGLVPDIAPEFVHFSDGFRDSPEWGSSSIILPWYLYQWYGDKQVLREAYSMMQRYAAYLEKKSSGYILSHGLGDWFDIGPNRPGESQLTPKGVTATAMFYYDLSILSKVAQVLGKQQDVLKYKALAGKVRAAFNNAFFNPTTMQYATGSQTANAMAVYMELVKPEHKKAVVENIVEDIRARKNSLTAGDIGYRYLLRVLEDNGRSDVIFDMNNRADVPGYGFQLAHGATSLTESWQAYRFVSNNHFMLGHLMEWFYSGLAGIRQSKNSIGFKHVVIRPEPVGDVTHAEAGYVSPYGNITSKWKKDNGIFELKTIIPVNTTATVFLPAAKDDRIAESGKSVAGRSDIKVLGYEQGNVLIAVGSGEYFFRIN
ncbi:MAG TPA: family 78 glycoside hydrolase catalytic domain [Agriterribacter sp.]|nr:family 78 glycoside hydrolase catalytic domain [Agriterribacter sp.]